MKNKDSVLKKFEEKYKRISVELGKAVIEAKDYRNTKGSPGLKMLKDHTGYTFLEAERAIGIKRKKKDMTCKNKKIYDIINRQGKIKGKIWCERGKGEKIKRSQCLRGCNDACHTCNDAIRLNIPFMVIEDEILTKSEEEESKYSNQSILAGFVT